MPNDTRPAPAAPADQRAQPAPRFIESAEQRRVPLGRTHTDEEAELAAEIEKLRG